MTTTTLDKPEGIAALNASIQIIKDSIEEQDGGHFNVKVEVGCCGAWGDCVGVEVSRPYLYRYIRCRRTIASLSFGVRCNDELVFILQRVVHIYYQNLMVNSRPRCHVLYFCK